MADEMNTTVAQQPSPDPATTPEKDWFLLEFIRLAELGVEQGITLSVGGTLVTGIVISGAKFFEMMAAAVDDAKRINLDNEGILDTLKENYQFFSTNVKEAELQISQLPARNYIHLQDARVVFGNTHIPTDNGVLWRGRVTAVDAFFSGSVKIG